MRRIAAPMVGGMVSSTMLTLLLIPALYAMVKGWRLPREEAMTAGPRSLKRLAELFGWPGHHKPPGVPADVTIRSWLPNKT